MLLYYTVHGGWSQWSPWSQCNGSCGSALTSRERNCSNPVPANEGRACEGAGVEEKECTPESCEGTYTAFTCVLIMDKHVRTCRSVLCVCALVNSSATVGCAFSIGVPLLTENTTCTEYFSGWSYWSPCSASCGQGTRQRVRNHLRSIISLDVDERRRVFALCPDTQSESCKISNCNTGQFTCMQHAQVCRCIT